MQNGQLRLIIEAALLAAGRSLDINAIENLFVEEELPERSQIKAILAEIEVACEARGYELKKTASGYRFQVRPELAPWINRLWEEKPKKYSRAMLETLALVAYRQPVTRGDIEQVRGVGVSSEIIRTLQEREWIRSVGHRDVPGRPALYATTRKFLDDFNLTSLDELPPLSEIRDIEVFNEEFGFAGPEISEGLSDDLDDNPAEEQGDILNEGRVEAAPSMLVANGEASDLLEDEEGIQDNFSRPDQPPSS
jgi:segregation and condensation protein B